MNENGKMKDNIGGKVIQANPKIAEKPMKKSRSRETKSSMDKGNEENNLTRT